MGLMQKVKRGERILLLSTLLFFFILSMYLYKENRYNGSIEVKFSEASFDDGEKVLAINTSMIVNDCRLKNDSEDKITCMVNYARDIEYNKTNPTYDIQEMFVLGTNCEGFCNFYSQISNMINLHHKKAGLYYGDKGHCASIIVGETHYCFVNQWSQHCYGW